MRRLLVLAELFDMVRQRRSWILVPPLLALALVATLMIVGQATPLGPFVYPLF